MLKTPRLKERIPIKRNWFLEQLQRQRWTQDKWAKFLGIQGPQISFLLAGQRRMTMGEAVATAKGWNVPLEDVLAAAGIRAESLGVSRGSIEIAGYVDGSSECHYGPVKGPRTAPAPIQAGRGTKVVRFETAGTLLSPFDGGLAFFDRQDGVAADALEKLCVIETGKRVLVGVVRRGYGVGVYNVTSLAGERLADGVGLKSASPVIWLKMG